MYYGIWDNVTFQPTWPIFIPIIHINSQNCQRPIPTQTHLQNLNPIISVQNLVEEEKRPLIDLTKQDLLDAGYQTTKKLWTRQQDELLLRLVDGEKIPWKQIQNHIPQRTQKMCHSRYRRLLSQTKQPWSHEQNQLLQGLVQQSGENWKQFAHLFKHRSSKQLKQRYVNYLRPQIKHDQWSLEEDMKIIQCINLYGKKWKVIQQEMKNRTDNQIKNRYYGRLKILNRNKIIKQRKKIKRNR